MAWWLLILGPLFLPVLGFFTCCCGCVIFSDEFTRDDTDPIDNDLGSEWTVIGGNAAIDGNTLRITTSDTKVESVADNGVRPVQLTVMARGYVEGDAPRLYTNGGSIFVEFAASTTANTVRLVTTTGESSINTFASGFDTPVDMSLCVVKVGTSYYVRGTVGPHTFYRWTDYTSSKSGVGTGGLPGGSGGVTFDNFSLNRTVADNADCADCSTTTCGCLPGTPTQLQVDYVTTGPTDPIFAPPEGLCSCEHSGSALLDATGEGACEWGWTADPEDIEELLVCQVIGITATIERSAGDPPYTYTIRGFVFFGYKNPDNSLVTFGSVSFMRTLATTSDALIDCETVMVGDLDPDQDLPTGTGDYYCQGEAFAISVP